MKNVISILAIAILGVSCGNKMAQTADSADSITTDSVVAKVADYTGVYEGTLPAADCPGIRVTLTLLPDNHFTRVDSFLERNSYASEGIYSLLNDSIIKTIVDKDTTLFRIEENSLRQLDHEGNPFTGIIAPRFVLKKIK